MTDVVQRSPDAMREKVSLIERAMEQMEQLELDVKHHFSMGIYARELFITKGTTLTAKETLNVLGSGSDRR